MAKKQRKSRDYSSLLRSTNAPDLPSPEEVNEQVSAITNQPLKKVALNKFKQEEEPEMLVANEPVLITEYHLMKDEDLKEKVEKEEVKIPLASSTTEEESKRGRKPLEVKRVPYTTSITKDHKFQIKYHAMKKGIRPSDMLNQILEKFFKENKI